MNLYMIPVSLNSTLSQEEIFRVLQTEQLAYVQASGGICVKSNDRLGDLVNHLQSITPNKKWPLRELSKDEAASTDLAAFACESTRT